MGIWGNEELRMKNEELPCGVLALRSQILHSSFLILH